jgi:hypothetical protein
LISKCFKFVDRGVNKFEMYANKFPLLWMEA